MRRHRLSRRAAPRRPASSRRAGFTIVELVVAILVLTIGLLGLASTAAVVTRQMGSTMQQTIAAQVAQTRFEQLRSNYNCSSLSSGSGTRAKNVREWWTVTNGHGAVTVKDSVVYYVRNQQKYQVYNTIVSCPALP